MLRQNNIYLHFAHHATYVFLMYILLIVNSLICWGTMYYILYGGSIYIYNIIPLYKIAIYI